MLEQIQERRLGPVDVLHHHHERPLARDGFQELAHRPPSLLHGHASGHEACGPRHSGGDQLGLIARRPAAGGRGECRLGGGPSQPPRDLCDRPIGDPLPVGQTPPDDRRSLLAKVGAKRTYQARLTDARRTEDRDEAGLERRNNLVEGVAQEAQLGFTTDERRHRAIRCFEGAGRNRHQPPRRYRRRLTLERERIHRRELRVRSHETGRVLAEQHLTRRG